MADFLVSTFGPTLRNHDGTLVSTDSVKAEMIGVYFSAHWCPPCRAFTPILSKAYLEIQKNNKSFEIIFVSSDHSAVEFEEYYRSMPWLALPYDSSARKVLGMRYQVSGIPTLILLNKNGTMVSPNGKQEVTKPTFMYSLPDKLADHKSIDDYLDSLMTDESLDVKTKNIGLKTLIKILSNIVQHPEDAKYRRLDKMSDTFREKLKSRKFVNILLATGFEDKGEVLVLPSNASTEIIKDIQTVLSAVYETFADA